MFEFRKLAKDVYAFLQPPLVCYSSAGVIIGDRDVIVVDSLTNAAMTQSLRTEIRRVTDKPIGFLINTHSHFDHVYTNHLFPEATVISTHRGREETKANQKVQAKHDALFAGLFADVDLRGGRYTLQDMSFSGSLSLYQGEREIRVLELGVGHSDPEGRDGDHKARVAPCGKKSPPRVLPPGNLEPTSLRETARRRGRPIAAIGDGRGRTGIAVKEDLWPSPRQVGAQALARRRHFPPTGSLRPTPVLARAGLL
ncbi:MAG TPA: MBL fold metallo-hydrolase [Syntrophobacteria bacterium]|nr:MBL fold metallo-hydrolase [Syntrophobacteria bacterium]